MPEWTRESVLRWIEAHADREIVIRQVGSALRVQGICKGVEELDACSALYQECKLVLAGLAVELALCFHADTLSVQIIAYHPKTGEVIVSIPVSIPFSALLLSEPGADKAQAADAKAPAFSPYELL